MYEFKIVEESARKVWEKNKKEIEQAIQGNSKKPLFSFLEGPPSANGPPGLHHLEVRTFKDIICKFKYMQGFAVPRKGGWDCHGLPIEVQVEKELGLKDKKDIVNYGVEKFTKKARESVFSYIKDWNISTEELNYLIDLKNPYITLENNYIESVWWALKELYKKNLLYEGHKVIPFCTRCGTPLSSHEVAQGYKDITETSLYVAFKLKNKGEYILAWTTTPWTLPGNVALAVGKKINYVKIKLPDGDTIIVGKEKADLIKDGKIIEEFKGKDLEDLEYKPLYNIPETKNKNSHKIILADFVTTDEGTGVVHTAGMYGPEDYELCKEKNLPLVHTVGEDGKFLEFVPKFSGKYVKSSEKEIIEDLKQRHLLFKSEKFTHSYPFCWRCNSPLLHYAINSWFINVTKIKDKIIKLNKEINWYPQHIKDGRFGKWLEGAKDWTLSRFKFWGTPLPIWKCSCGNEKIIGSIEELKKEAIKIPKGELDFHKPWIDKIKLKCKCGKEMMRVEDVIDCWFDSGSATFAQFHYPFENKKEFEKRFPYDFISEAIDQTRGWFYTMHVISSILFGKPAYKNVVCAGHVVDEKGEKMSKSKGNIIKPREIIDRAGVDAVRLQFCTSDSGNQKRFSFDLMKESVIPFLTVLYNTNKYYQMLEDKKLKIKIEDKWILSKLNSLVREATIDLENYSFNSCFEKIINFVVKDLSRGYIRLTRERDDTKKIIAEVLEKIILILAPFAPHISEYIFQNFSKNSVHLSSWPKEDRKKINKKLEEKFELIIKIIETGLSSRDKIQIGLKWPLASATIIGGDFKLKKDEEEIVTTQLNVKKLLYRKHNTNEKNNELAVNLDTKMTLKLEAEGYGRQTSRQIQEFRKKIGLNKKDKVEIILIVDEEFKKILDSQKDFIKKRTNSKKINIVTTNKERFKNKTDFKIKNKKGEIVIIC